MLSDEYIAERKHIQELLSQKEERVAKLKDSVANVNAFIEKARAYCNIRELTPELLHHFIARIEIGEREQKHSRTAPQNITIRYRDVGVLENFAQDDTNDTTCSA